MKNGLPAVRLVQAAGELGSSPIELRRLVLLEPLERDPLDDVIAAEVGEHPRGIGDEVGLVAAQGDEHDHRRAVQAADDVARAAAASAGRPSAGRRARARAGARRRRGRAVARDRLEQPVAAVSRLGGLARRRAPSSGTSGASSPRRRAAEQVAGVGGVVAQRLHERLVRDERLLVEAPVEHRRAAARAPRPRSSAASRVLPIPASPASTTTPPSPAGVRAQRRRSAASSASRPTNGRSSRATSTAGSGSAVAAGVGGLGAGVSPSMQQAVVQRGDVRSGCRAELVAQQHAQPVVDAQGLGDVAARRQELHQHGVAGLAVGLALDQRARRAVGGR